MSHLDSEDEDDQEREDRLLQDEEREDEDSHTITLTSNRRRRQAELNTQDERRLRQRLGITNPPGGIDDVEDIRTSSDNQADDETLRVTNQPPTSPPPTTLPIAPFGIQATLARAFPNGFPPELLVEELKVQTEICGDGARMAAFRVETLQHQGLTAFAFLQQRDMTIYLMHSPATYHARGATGPLKGRDIGFVGDRTDYSSPAPIVLQPEKPWKWITNRFDTSELNIEAFYCNPNNVDKFYIPSTSIQLDRITIPRLLLLPSNLLDYCAASPRTPLDLLRHVRQLMSVMTQLPETTTTFTRHDYELVAKWCCAALHNDKGDSMLSYDIQAAVGNETFQRWTRTRIDATLGPLPIHTSQYQPQSQQPIQLNDEAIQNTPGQTVTFRTAVTPPRGQPIATATQPVQHIPPTAPHVPQPHAGSTPIHQNLSSIATLAAEFGKGIMAALQPGVALGTGASATANDKKEYDEFQRAILQGFAHTPTPAGLPTIWSLFCQTKSADTHRLHIKEAMNQWARNAGVTINRGMYLTKVAIDDIVNLRFNPGGSSAYYASAEKGISILLCRSRPGEDRESARQQELAEEISSHTRSLSEAVTLAKTAPRAPPDTYTDLKASIGTFCALTWALFGGGCEYHKKLYELYNCLDSERVSEDWANFTPLLCRQITWAIIDDGREYFAQYMLPDRFNVPLGTAIQYPQSSLEELIRPIRTQSPILRASFPSQWLPRSEGLTGGNTISRPNPVAPIGSVSITTSNRGGGNQSVRSITSSITNGTAPTKKTLVKEIRADSIHPLIKQNFGPHFQRFGQLQLSRLMKLSGMTWTQMPKLDKYLNGTTNKLCYNYVLGRCTTKYCSHKSGHAPAEDITTAFAHEICTVLMPGLKAMTETIMDMAWPEFLAFAEDRIRQQQAAVNATA